MFIHVHTECTPISHHTQGYTITNCCLFRNITVTHTSGANRRSTMLPHNIIGLWTVFLCHSGEQSTIKKQTSGSPKEKSQSSMEASPVSLFTSEMASGPADFSPLFVMKFLCFLLLFMVLRLKTNGKNHLKVTS